MDKTFDNVESIEKQEEHGHSLEKRRADDLDEEERQLEALIEEVYSTKAMKSSPLLGPFCGSEFLGFSLLKI